MYIIPFLKAGWTHAGWSKSGLRILECFEARTLDIQNQEDAVKSAKGMISFSMRGSR
jgi:hypothetical protein